MKVLITHSYFLHFDAKQLQNKTPYPPLATLYAASALRQSGHEVRFVDMQFAASPSEILPHLEEFKPNAFVIYDDGFNYLTKMCLTNMREAAWQMQQMAADKNIPVLISSSDATDHAKDYLMHGASRILIGEAENSLLESLKFLHDQEREIKGTAILKNGDLFKFSQRPVTRDLDDLPEPAWDLLNIEPYKEMWLQKHNYFSINLVTTRGCPFKCNWCAKPIYGNRYNSHTPQYIVRQILQTQTKFGYEHVWFADDIFGLKPGWLREFNDLLKESKIKIKYKIQSRADLLLEDDTIRYLKESGCDEVWMGAESGSQKILDAMDKGITIQQIRDAVLKLKSAGIKPSLFLQFGYPGEEISDIRATLQMVSDLSPYDIGVSVSYPLPGTVFYENVKSQLGVKTNWTDSDDLALLFRNKFSPEFYRHLHKYLHHQFRGSQAGTDHLLSRKNSIRRKLLWPYHLCMAQLEKSRIKKMERNAAGLF